MSVPHPSPGIAALDCPWAATGKPPTNGAGCRPTNWVRTNPSDCLPWT